MKIEPAGESRQPPEKEGVREQPKQGGKSFADALRDLERDELKKAFRREDEPPSPLKPEKKKEKQKEKPKTKQKPEVKEQVGQQTKGEVKVEVGTAKGATGMNTQIDRIVQIFQTQSVFNAQLSTVQVSQVGNEAQVFVVLTNGIQVSVDIAPGGRELNVSIRGVSAQAQAQMDNPQNQAALRDSLAQQGFVVHKFETYRAEELQPRGGEGRQQREGEEEGEKG